VQKTYLFGPFIGELSWELFRFAPYAIYLRRRESANIIVFTRSERFDLYGSYANILVPLSLPDDSEEDCFKINGIDYYDYKILADIFYSKYNEKMEITDHFYPEIRGFKYRLKWQFPRYKMDYDFRPRAENIELIESIIEDGSIFIDLSWMNTDQTKMEMIEKLYNHIDSTNVILCGIKDLETPFLSVDNIEIKPGCSLLGYVISILRKSKLCIGNPYSPISHLSLLLGVSLASISPNLIDEDSLGLINPKKTNFFQLNPNDLSSIRRYYDNHLIIG